MSQPLNQREPNTGALVRPAVLAFDAVKSLE